MMRESTPVVERPGLEDVAEEEDAFAAERGSKSPLEPSSCQVPEETDATGPQEDEQLSESQMAAEFAQLNLRKQVSYSCPHNLPDISAE